MFEELHQNVSAQRRSPFSNKKPIADKENDDISQHKTVRNNVSKTPRPVLESMKQFSF